MGRPLHAGVQFVAALLDGTAFEETGLIAPFMSPSGEESLSFGNAPVCSAYAYSRTTGDW